MERRNVLKAAGASLGAMGVVSGASSTAAASPADRWRPAHYSNYTSANRSAANINWIVVHYTVGAYAGAINWFQDPNANVSAHYVIRNSDGHITKMVDESNVAYHASGFNGNAIGIEHEWVEGQNGFSDSLYSSSAELIEHLADQFDIPLEYYTDVSAPCREAGGIIEHRHAPTNGSCSRSNSTSCPGPYDGGTLMSYIDSSGGGGSGTFEDGQAIRAASTVNTRERPGLGDDVVDQFEEGEPGKIVNGPIEEDGYTWWGIHWTDAGVWGWSAEGLLEACPGFCHGTRIQTTTDLNARWGPGLEYYTRHTVPEGQTGEIIQGPRQGDDYNWWQIEWDSGIDGWSADGDWLVTE